jgi:hypothetical protein
MASTAQITITHVDGYYHVQCNTLGATTDEAQKLARDVLCFFAQDRLAFIRNEPEAEAHRDYERGNMSRSTRDTIDARANRKLGK